MPLKLSPVVFVRGVMSNLPFCWPTVTSGSVEPGICVNKPPLKIRGSGVGPAKSPVMVGVGVGFGFGEPLKLALVLPVLCVGGTSVREGL